MRRPGFFRSVSGHRAGWPSWGLLARRPRLDEDRLVGLASDDPLARATEALRCAARQWNHVAAVFLGSGIARAEGERWASSLACSACGVVVMLSLLLAVRIQARRDRVTDVILEGREDLPVAVVQRKRRRLVSERNRAGLARSLEEMARDARAPRSGRARLIPALFEPRVIAQVADELRELGTILRTERVSARGVASLERLVSHATSALYGREVAALQEQLCDARELLKEHER